MKKLQNIISKLDAKRRFAPLLRSVLTLFCCSSKTKCWCFTFLSYLVLAIILSFAPLRTSAQEQAHVHINVLNQLSEYVPNSLIQIKDQKGNILKKTVTKTETVSIKLPLNQFFVLEISSEGFKPHKQNLKLTEKEETIAIVLDLEDIKADVIVGKDELDIAEPFKKTLTADEINALPSDPRKIESELKRKYGEDAIIKINGFTGGRLPPKEKISSIKVIKSSFDAEFHTAGKTVVDVRTRAGASFFLGVAAFSFNDARLNARNTFALKRLPEQDKLFLGYLAGPIVKDKSSFSATLLARDVFKTNDIVAVVPDKTFDRNVKSVSRMAFAEIGTDYNLNKTHTLNLSYAFQDRNNANEGIGGLKLPETGFSLSDKFNQLRLFESGVINKKFVNEFRFEFIKHRVNLTPNNTSPSINVLGEFISGGAVANNQTDVQQLNFTDNLFFDEANHLLKFGLDFRFERRKILSRDGLNGSFTFTNVDNFRRNVPDVFTRRQAEILNSVNQTQFALYAQDDIRLYRNFQIGLGLRYELQNNLSDKNNFSPRISFVFSPTKEGQIVFRGGTGLFNHWLETGMISNVLGNTFEQASDLIVLGNDTRLPPSFKILGDNLVNPSVFVAQIGANLRAHRNLNIETSYKFQRGTHLFRSRDINAPINVNRPKPAFGRISQLESSGISSEHSLNINAEGKIKNVSFNVRYKLSQLKDNFDGTFGLPADSNDLSKEYSFSNLDRRHAISGNLDFRLFKKLQIIPVFRVYSPLPYTVTTGKDDNGNTVFNDRPINVKRNSERGDWLKQLDLVLSSRFFFGTEAKSAPPGGVTSNDDIIKSLKNSIGFNFSIQNVFNTTNLRDFIGNRASPLFGQATSSATTRKLRIEVNYIF